MRRLTLTIQIILYVIETALHLQTTVSHGSSSWYLSSTSSSSSSSSTSSTTSTGYTASESSTSTSSSSSSLSSYYSNTTSYSASVSSSSSSSSSPSPTLSSLSSSPDPLLPSHSLYLILLGVTLILSSALINILSAVWIYRHLDFQGRRVGHCVCVLMHLTQTGVVWRYLRIIWNNDDKDVKEFLQIRVIQTTIQSFPFILIQGAYIFVYGSYGDITNTDLNLKYEISWLSLLLPLAVSIVSLTVAYACNELCDVSINSINSPARRQKDVEIDDERLVQIADHQTNGILTYISWIILTVAKLLLITSRCLCLIMLIHAYKYWVLFFLGAHTFIHGSVLLVLGALERRGERSRANTEETTNVNRPAAASSFLWVAFRATVHVCDYVFPIRSGANDAELFLFYAIVVAENVVLSLSWYLNGVSRSLVCRSEVFGSTLVCVFVGVLFMAIYVILLRGKLKVNLSETCGGAGESGRSNSLTTSSDTVQSQSQATTIESATTNSLQNTNCFSDNIGSVILHVDRHAVAETAVFKEAAGKIHSQQTKLEPRNSETLQGSVNFARDNKDMNSLPVNRPTTDHINEVKASVNKLKGQSSGHTLKSRSLSFNMALERSDTKTKGALVTTGRPRASLGSRLGSGVRGHTTNHIHTCNNTSTGRLETVGIEPSIDVFPTHTHTSSCESGIDVVEAMVDAQWRAGKHCRRAGDEEGSDYFSGDAFEIGTLAGSLVDEINSNPSNPSSRTSVTSSIPPVSILSTVPQLPEIGPMVPSASGKLNTPKIKSDNTMAYSTTNPDSRCMAIPTSGSMRSASNGISIQINTVNPIPSANITSIPSKTPSMSTATNQDFYTMHDSGYTGCTASSNSSGYHQQPPNRKCYVTGSGTLLTGSGTLHTGSSYPQLLDTAANALTSPKCMRPAAQRLLEYNNDDEYDESALSSVSSSSCGGYTSHTSQPSPYVFTTDSELEERSSYCIATHARPLHWQTLPLPRTKTWRNRANINNQARTRKRPNQLKYSQSLTVSNQQATTLNGYNTKQRDFNTPGNINTPCELNVISNPICHIPKMNTARNQLGQHTQSFVQVQQQWGTPYESSLYSTTDVGSRSMYDLRDHRGARRGAADSTTRSSYCSTCDDHLDDDDSDGSETDFTMTWPPSNRITRHNLRKLPVAQEAVPLRQTIARWLDQVNKSSMPSPSPRVQVPQEEGNDYINVPRSTRILGRREMLTETPVGLHLKPKHPDKQLNSTRRKKRKLQHNVPVLSRSTKNFAKHALRTLCSAHIPGSRNVRKIPLFKPSENAMPADPINATELPIGRETVV